MVLGAAATWLSACRAVASVHAGARLVHTHTCDMHKASLICWQLSDSSRMLCFPLNAISGVYDCRPLACMAMV